MLLRTSSVQLQVNIGTRRCIEGIMDIERKPWFSQLHCLCPPSQEKLQELKGQLLIEIEKRQASTSQMEQLQKDLKQHEWVFIYSALFTLNLTRNNMALWVVLQNEVWRAVVKVQWCARWEKEHPRAIWQRMLGHHKARGKIEGLQKECNL